jgi:hypothetical protein
MKNQNASNSLMAQRLRLKCYLEGHKKIATLKARSSEGKPHRVAEYVLMVGEQQTPAATGIQGDIDKTMGEYTHD